jgi:hypothetical protein
MALSPANLEGSKRGTGAAATLPGWGRRKKSRVPGASLRWGPRLTAGIPSRMTHRSEKTSLNNEAKASHQHLHILSNAGLFSQGPSGTTLPAACVRTNRARCPELPNSPVAFPHGRL